MIKIIIFDLGKVIVPFDTKRALKLFEAASKLDVSELNEKVQRIDENRLYHEGKISSEQLFRSFQNALRLDMSFEEFAGAWNSIFSLEPILPDALFRKLSEKYRLMVLSDTNEMHFEFVRRNFEVLRYFDDFVLSYEIGTLKPSKKVFQITLEKAGCSADECFFTDDKKENVEAARALGIDAVQFVSAKQLLSELKERGILPDLAQLTS